MRADLAFLAALGLATTPVLAALPVAADWRCTGEGPQRDPAELMPACHACLSKRSDENQEDG